MSVTPYDLPAYALVRIERISINKLPDGFKFVKSGSFGELNRTYNVITNGKSYFACVGEDHCVAFDMMRQPPFVLGYERGTLVEVESHIAQIRGELTSYDINRSQYELEKSPTGIRLSKNVPSYLRYCGVSFKNRDTQRIVYVTTTINDAFAEMGLSIAQSHNLCFDGRIVGGWYIESVDPTAKPLSRGKWDTKLAGMIFAKGEVSIDAALPRGTIVATTGLTRNNIKQLISDPNKAIDGWRLKTKDMAK